MSYTMICAVFNILGILSGKHISIFFIILLPIIGIAITLCRKKKNSMLILAFIMFAVGGILYKSASYNKLYDEFGEKYVTIDGTIISVPLSANDDNTYKYLFEPDKVTYLDKTTKTNTLMYIRTEEPYAYGDIIRVSGFLNEVSGGKNQYDYDYSQSYKSKGIYNQLTAFESEKTGEAGKLNPKYLFGRLKSLAFDAIHSKFSGDTAAIYTAILLGDKSHISPEYATKLLHTGIWQALYSPYIHITLIVLLAGLFRISKRRNGVLFALLVIYALFNLGNPNVLKASLLLASMVLCRIVLGYSNKMQQLSALILAMTILNPMLCYNRGFVLSVASTVILFVFYPTIYKALLSLKGKNSSAHSKPLSVLAIAITLTLCSFPIAAYLFNGISLYSTIITTLLIPVILIVLLLSVIYIPIVVSGGGLYWLESIMSTLLRFIEILPGLIEKLPFHYISSRTPTIIEVVTAYMILWLCRALLTKRKRDDIFKAVSAITLSLMLCLTFSANRTELEIYFVNVGQGDSAILHTNSETILIDGGGAPEYDTSCYNVGDRILVPYLVSHGFSEIDYAVVTHFHKDHAEGIISAIKNLRVNNIIMPDSSHDSIYRQTIESLAKEKDINIIFAEEDGMVSFKSGLKISFLAPNSIQKQSLEPNDTSIVAEIEYGNFSALFTSDTTDAVDSNYPRYVDLLKVAHHGSDTASSKSDIDHICPKYAVISVGENNSYGLPNKSVLENLDSVGASILRTDTMGDIRFKISKDGKISYKTLRKEL